MEKKKKFRTFTTFVRTKCVHNKSHKNGLRKEKNSNKKKIEIKK